MICWLKTDWFKCDRIILAYTMSGQQHYILDHIINVAWHLKKSNNPAYCCNFHSFELFFHKEYFFKHTLECLSIPPVFLTLWYTLLGNQATWWIRHVICRGLLSIFITVLSQQARVPVGWADNSRVRRAYTHTQTFSRVPLTCICNVTLRFTLIPLRCSRTSLIYISRSVHKPL